MGLSAVEHWARAELRPGTPDQPTWLDAAQRLLADVKLAGDDAIARRSAAAAYGGLLRRWRTAIVVHITSSVLSPETTSRIHARAWQQRLFGRAVGSRELARYATPTRSGGGRAAPAAVPPDLEDEAVLLYYRLLGALSKAAA